MASTRGNGVTMRIARTGALIACLIAALPAAAQSNDEGRDTRPRRYRVALGPQVEPRYPGADGVQLRPLIDIARARGDDPFEFEAADESAGIALFDRGGFAIGPAFNIEGSRRRRHVDRADADEVGTSVELGGFAQYWLTPGLRAYGEVRKGVNGHKGVVSDLGFDYVARDGDRWLVSLGPRVSLSDRRYQQAYFGVSPRTALGTGLPRFDADGGVHAVGATAGTIYQFSRRWGVYGYAKYDRLIADAGRSPFVRAFGNRNQFSGGAALTFTFGRGVR